jgi:hypothetical protein
MENNGNPCRFLGSKAARKSTRLLLMIGIFLSVAGILFTGASEPAMQSAALTPRPTPAYDPLAIPVLSENPTEFDLGKYSYYYNCMPCHGDRGQGLTDEWRQTWEEDHRNCWGRGCHGGREKDEGFPIPTVIPAVILDGDALQKFTNQDDLLAYLRATHPPQSPGRLSEEDYHALVAYLWAANGKDADHSIQEQVQVSSTVQWTQIVAFGLAGIIVLTLIGIAYLQKRRKTG